MSINTLGIQSPPNQRGIILLSSSVKHSIHVHLLNMKLSCGGICPLPNIHVAHVPLESRGTHTTKTIFKVSKGAKIRNRYNQVPHLTQDTNGKVTHSQLDTTNESQEVSPFPAGDHKAHINRCVQRHSKHKTEKNRKKPQKK